MKFNKGALAGLASLAGLTLASSFTVSTAMAATSTARYTMAATHINLDRKNISNPQHVIAKDPWGGAETTWVPIYYLQQALKQVGFETKWNGTDLTFTKYPTNWTFDTAFGNPEAVPIVVPKGQMQISLVDGGPPSMNIPKVVAKDPASGVDTTYVPVFYVNNVLTYYFKMGATWDGAHNTWTLTSQ